MPATDKQPYGGFAATLKRDRLDGLELRREMDSLAYYTAKMLARINPVYRHRLNDHLDAQCAYKRAWR